MFNLQKIKKDKFLWGSFILTLSFFVYNASNFFYQFIAARFLGPEDYAVIASLFSIIYLLAVGSTAIQTSVTKFTSIFYSKKQFNKIKYLEIKGIKKIFNYSVYLFLGYLLLSYFLSKFLHTALFATLTVSVLLLIIFILPINRGIMQGMQKFEKLGKNIVLEGFLKLTFLIIFLALGFKVLGALWAVNLSVIIAFLFSFIKLKVPAQKFDSKNIYSFSYPVVYSIFSITAMYSLDILLIKNLFTPLEAGQYSAISLLGRIIFFGTIAISLAMFSKTSELHAKKKNTEKILNKALGLTLFISLGLILVYFMFSKLIINLIFGSAYLPIAHLLGFFGLFMGLLSLSYILILHKLSIDKTKFVYSLFLFNLIEIIGIYIFKNSLSAIIYFLVIFALSLFLYLWKVK